MFNRLIRTIVTPIICSLSPLLLAADATTAPTTQPVHLLPPGQTIKELSAYLRPLVPKFETPTDPDVWMKEAAKIRERMLSDVIFRNVPEDWNKPETNIVWGDTVQGKGYIIKKLRYEILPGFWTGALFYIPDNLKGKVPAMLNVNGHVGPEGMAIAYEQIRRINLAKRGMLALGLEWPGIGELSASEYSHHGAAYLELCGISGVSVHYLALRRGLDILLQNEHADPERVALTGLSGGGWQTIMLSSLDTRIKLCAPNAGYYGFDARIDTPMDAGDEEQCPTDMGLVADYVHLTAMMAPRPTLIIANDKDTCCFLPPATKKSIVDPIRPVYELFGKPDRFDFHVNSDPGTHNYDKDNRQAFYKFVNRHFLPEDQRKDDEIVVDDEVRKQSELAIDYPKDNGSFHSLVVEAMKSLPVSKSPSGSDRAALNEWRKKTRDALRSVIRLSSSRPDVTVIASDIKARAPKGVVTHSWLLKIGDAWTIPIVEYRMEASEPTANTLILCDENREKVMDLVKESLGSRQRAYVADILFTGECISPFSDTASYRWGLLIAALGERTLGLQVEQLDSITGWIKSQHPMLPLNAATRNRMSGLATLVHAALQPGNFDHINLLGLEATFKDLLRMKMNDIQSVSVFCTGLFKLVDIPELRDLAAPTHVDSGGR